MNATGPADVTINIVKRNMTCFRLAALAMLAVTGLAVPGAPAAPVTPAMAEPAVVRYDAERYPNIYCLAGRVIAETDPALSAQARAELWRGYGVTPTFEWINAESGFTYHELTVERPSGLDLLASFLPGRDLPPRELPALVKALGEDPRVRWACPDALLLEWCDAPAISGEEELLGGMARVDDANNHADRSTGPRGVSLLAPPYKVFTGTAEEWAKLEDTPDPLPDFEYYRECAPQGTLVNWADELKDSDGFMERCRMAYGTNQAKARYDYYSAGSLPLSPVTVCVADTGVFTNHPELADRLHPSAIDANYTSYEVADAAARPGATDEITERDTDIAIGLPREAIKQRPSSHGTCVAGIIARCTDGFLGADGKNAVRLLPASVRSDKPMVIIGFKVKTPISAAIKLVACLNEHFPTGDFQPAPDDPVQNTGDVRVVSMSASVPKAHFSDAEWRLVSPLVGKAAGTIAEDLRDNDRVYLFAAGNESQPEPNRPGDEPYVLAVSATSAYDGGLAWDVPGFEGSNLGMKCVSAPGYGIITSTTYPHPNLAYLPENEFRSDLPAWSIPPRDGHVWHGQTNTFSATSSATPQVGALAALLIGQDPGRNYLTVIQLIEQSAGNRTIRAEWGEARGIVDYAAALRYDEYLDY